MKMYVPYFGGSQLGCPESDLDMILRRNEANGETVQIIEFYFDPKDAKTYKTLPPEKN